MIKPVKVTLVVKRVLDMTQLVSVLGIKYFEFKIRVGLCALAARLVPMPSVKVF